MYDYTSIWNHTIHHLGFTLLHIHIPLTVFKPYIRSTQAWNISGCLLELRFCLGNLIQLFYIDFTNDHINMQDIHPLIGHISDHSSTPGHPSHNFYYVRHEFLCVLTFFEAYFWYLDDVIECSLDNKHSTIVFHLWVTELIFMLISTTTSHLKYLVVSITFLCHFHLVFGFLII